MIIKTKDGEELELTAKSLSTTYSKGECHNFKLNLKDFALGKFVKVHYEALLSTCIWEGKHTSFLTTKLSNDGGSIGCKRFNKTIYTLIIAAAKRAKKAAPKKKAKTKKKK